MRKSDRHEAIRTRAARAIADLYHNATPDYPRLNDADGERFQAWFGDAAQFEIEYINDGGAYGSDASYRGVLERNAATRWPGDAAPGSLTYIKRAYFVHAGMRSMRLERDTNKHARWERIGEYGKVYTWGRGRRTLAPDDLVIKRGGGSFGLGAGARAFDADLSIAAVVELTLIVESFNAYVEAWCKSVPEQWKEQEADRIAEEQHERDMIERERDAFYAGM